MTPELVNTVIQPLISHLEHSERERGRLHDENVELAGRIGFYQAKLQEYEQKILSLGAPKEDPGGVTELTVAAPEPAMRPWWKRLFGLE